MHTSAPLPSVSSRIALDRVLLRRVDGVRRAELLRPLELLRVEVDGDDRARTDEAWRRRSRRRRRRRSRTRRRCRRGRRRRCSPRRRTRPSRRSRAGPRPRVARRGRPSWPGPRRRASSRRTRRCRARATASVPSASVIFCVALCVAKQYHGRPRRHARHSPHTARQLRTTKSPGATLGDVGTDRLDDARGLVAEQVREVVADAALAVVQVGVAHAARLHARRAPRPGPGSGTTIVSTRTGSPFAGATTPRTSCATAADATADGSEPVVARAVSAAAAAVARGFSARSMTSGVVQRAENAKQGWTAPITLWMR